MSRDKIINYIILILLPQIVYTVVVTDTSQNAAKRFTLQDLFGSQGSQLAPQQPVTEEATTKTVDIQTLLAAAQRAAASQQPSVETSQFSSNNNNNKPVDLDVKADKNGNINLADLPGLSSNAAHNNQETSNNVLSLSDLQSLIAKQTGQQVPAAENNIVKEELDLGKEKVELETAGKRATRYALAKGPDGGLNLVPVVEGAQQTDGNKFQVLQPKGFEEKGSNRQQMQLTTLSQALYSPFPSDQNTLHLHLKGKDGKDGKAGNKGSMGPLGPKGPEGPKGAKGDAGTCSSQINGLFECTPDELDSLSNRVDYLEKICHKVESAAKKHKIHSNNTKSINKEENKEQQDGEHKENNKVKEVEHVKEKEQSKPEHDKGNEENKPEHAKEKEESKIEHKEEASVKEPAKESKQSDKVEKGEKEASKHIESKNDETGEKKYITSKNYTDDKKTSEDSKTSAGNSKTFQNSASAALKSMIDIRAKLKISELDILDRIKQAKEGTMKNL